METFEITVTHHANCGSLITCPCGFEWMSTSWDIALSVAKDHVDSHKLLGDHARIRRVVPREVKYNPLLVERRAVRALSR